MKYAMHTCHFRGYEHLSVKETVRNIKYSGYEWSQMLKHVRAFVAECDCRKGRLNTEQEGTANVSLDEVSPQIDVSRCRVFVPSPDDDVRASFPLRLDEVHYSFDDQVDFTTGDRTKYIEVVKDIMRTIDESYLTESLILATEAEHRSKAENQILGLLVALRASSGIEHTYVVTRSKFYQAIMAHRVIRLAQELRENVFRHEEESF
jgi:hypothetical protein